MKQFTLTAKCEPHVRNCSDLASSYGIRNERQCFSYPRWMSGEGSCIGRYSMAIPNCSSIGFKERANSRVGIPAESFMDGRKKLKGSLIGFYRLLVAATKPPTGWTLGVSDDGFVLGATAREAVPAGEV